MTHRKDVVIKTRYMSIEECSVNCIDSWGKMTIPFGFSKKIYGVVYDDYTFWMSSCSKMGSIFKFEGLIEKREETVLLVGNISVKIGYLISLYVMCFLLTFTGLVVAFSVSPFGVLLIAIGWLYIIIMNKSDVLYNYLVKKVQ